MPKDSMPKVREGKPPEFIWADEAGFWVALGPVLIGFLVLLAATNEAGIIYFIDRMSGLHQGLLVGTLILGGLSFGTAILDHKNRLLIVAGLGCVVLQTLGLSSGSECCSQVVRLLRGESEWNARAWSILATYLFPFMGNAALLVLYPRNKRARISQ